jgi:hypothetical protein
MALSPEPPPPSAQKTNPTPFPRYKPPDPIFPPNFSWDDAAFRPETFLDSFESDYGGRQLELRNKIVENLRGPLTFQHQCQFQSWNVRVARGVTPIHFQSAVSLVTAALDRGYYPNEAEPLLSTAEWAELACAVVAAAGRGYARTHNEENAACIYAARFSSRDTVPEKSKLSFDSLFHRLGATAEALQTYVEGDEQVASWLPGIEEETVELYQYLANKHVEEALATWEGLEVSRLANLMLPDLPQQAHEANLSKLQSVASKLGYELVPKTPSQATGTATAPTTAPVAAPRSSSPPHRDDRLHSHPPNIDMNALTAAIQAAMKPLMSRIEAVERASLHASAATPQRTGAATVSDAPRAALAPSARVPQPNQPPNAAAPRATNLHSATPPNTTHHTQDEDWTTVTNKRKRKRGGKKPVPDQANQPLQQIILTPRSYAATAATPPIPQTNKQTPSTPAGGEALLPFTEVTILCFGGSMNDNSERAVRAHQLDAIVREVKASISRAVAKPLPIVAGRWSSGTRSRGNFVFTMRGQIDFATIQKFEHFLVNPFPGGGQLCPNQGWTKLLAHGVPVLDNDDYVFGPDDLLKEVRSIPGLHNAYFSSAPHWVKPIESMASCYSSLTFAFSDPDGTITKQILGNK